MAATRILSIIGRKNAGKTTLTVALAGEFARRGHRVMTIKHGHHPMDVDRRGTDSWRHFHEGRAERVLLATPGLRALFERAEDDYDPVALARRYHAGADVVLVEGYKRAAVPKVEVFRTEVAGGPIYGEPGFEPGAWIAIVTNDSDLQADCPVLRFQDTMWLQLLANLAWAQALVLPE